ncbi:MAG: tripartite tricarboxylate transporter TctB family protein [Desulfobacteraceae bacterium]|nr:MAG: tripartite tricarboxylate transporter TctB family protein [Desulfobacteraceae bacterium]
MFDAMNVFLLVFSIFFAVGGYRLGLGSLTKPGPGFVIFFASVALSLFCVYGFLSSKGDTGWRPVFSGTGLKKIIPVIVSLFLYGKFMPVVGYLISTFILTWFLLFLSGNRMYKAIGLAVLTAVVSWYCFSSLGSELPAGLTGFLG